MRVKRQLLVVCLLLLATSLTACNRGRGVQAARDDRAATVSESEQNFMMKAAQANLVEIKAARIALEKSDNSDVKDYANMIKNDHTSALEDLADVMKDQNVQQSKTIDSDTQQDIDRMSNLSGGEFDREFVNMMVSDHEKAIELFRDQQSSAQNRDVKNYVDQALPKLEMHLDKALRLQTKLFSAPNKPVSQPPTAR